MASNLLYLVSSIHSTKVAKILQINDMWHGKRDTLNVYNSFICYTLNENKYFIHKTVDLKTPISSLQIKAHPHSCLSI